MRVSNMLLIYILSFSVVSQNVVLTHQCSSEEEEEASFESLDNSNASTHGRRIENACKTKPRCGGVIAKTTGGGIFYKPLSAVMPNERCVWVVAAPKNKGYVVDVLHMGYLTNHPESNTQLIITSVNQERPGPSSRYYGFKSYKPTGTGTIDFKDANMLIVTFASGEDAHQSFGFALHFTTKSNNNYPSNSSKSYIFNSPVFQFNYPVGKEKYDNYELAALVFPPKDNIFTGRSNLIGYESLGLFTGQLDTVFSYRFEYSAALGKDNWEFVTRLDPRNETFQHVDNDTVLLIFMTHMGTTGSGFRVYFIRGVDDDETLLLSPDSTTEESVTESYERYY